MPKIQVKRKHMVDNRTGYQLHEFSKMLSSRRVTRGISKNSEGNWIGREVTCGSRACIKQDGYEDAVVKNIPKSNCNRSYRHRTLRACKNNPCKPVLILDGRHANTTGWLAPDVSIGSQMIHVANKYSNTIDALKNSEHYRNGKMKLYHGDVLDYMKQVAAEGGGFCSIWLDLMNTWGVRADELMENTVRFAFSSQILTNKSCFAVTSSYHGRKGEGSCAGLAEEMRGCIVQMAANAGYRATLSDQLIYMKSRTSGRYIETSKPNNSAMLYQAYSIVKL